MDGNAMATATDKSETRTTVIVDNELREICEEEGRRMGVGWTVALRILAREGKDARDKSRSNG